MKLGHCMTALITPMTESGEVDLTALSNLVEKLIAQIKPANIASELDLLYNRHSQFFGRTFGEMAAQTHHALRSEVQ